MKAGDPMILRTTGQAVPGLEWDREIFYVLRPNGRDIDYVLSGYLPRDAVEGQEVTLGYGAGKAVLTDGGTVRLRGVDHRLAKRWSGRDPLQRHYWSGPVNVRLYNEMLAVLGPAIKETNPAVRLAAGWGFNFFNENWLAWEQLIRPTIDQNHAWIVALHEHHYGNDTRRVAAAYEVAYAYTLARHGKRLEFWNTEAGGYLDPQQPGNARSGAPESPAARAVGAMTYLTRDIAYLLDEMPDKAVQRAAHEPQLNGGDLPALRLLKPVRGRLLAHESSGNVFSAAASEGRRLSVLVFNDSNRPADIPVRVTAPGGARFTGLAEHRLEIADAEPFVRVIDTRRDAAGPRWEGNVTVGGKNPVVLVFTLDSEPAATGRTVSRGQYVSPDVLSPFATGAVETRIAVPADALAAPRLAGGVLRLVLDEPGGGYDCEFNGAPLALADQPASLIWDLTLSREQLRADNTLVVRSKSKRGRLLAASLYLETITTAP